MQHQYRVTRRPTASIAHARQHVPNKDDTLVSSREQAVQLIAKLDKQIENRKTPRNNKAVYLCARAVLYEALGDRKMLDAAREAFEFSKTAQSAGLYAVALHHWGAIRESLAFYEQSYRYPHEEGWEVDIGYSGALLFKQTAEDWRKAWEIVKRLKKRMVYAAYLPFWDGKPCKEVSVLSEGGFGDLIHNSRYLPMIPADKVTVYLPPYFFESGFVDLCRRQPWFPEIKLLTQVPMKVPAAGFFDLPALFNTTPDTIPPSPVWCVHENSHVHVPVNNVKTVNIGFCWAARAMETPLCADGVYRALTEEQAARIVNGVDVNWVSLQKVVNNTPQGCQSFTERLSKPDLKGWEDTAAVIANLDLVVTVDTGVMHLAATMGKPTWVLLSGAIDWKFGLDGDCLWYPSIKTFRNNDFGFENSVTQVIESLNAKFNNYAVQHSPVCKNLS